MSDVTPRDLRADAAVKTVILRYLATAEHGASAVQVAAVVQRYPKLARQHLYELERSGRVISLTVGEGNTKRITWGLPGCELKQPKSITEQLPDSSIDIENATWPQRSHAPVGTWRLDHPTAARSVFEMGAA
jgi:hypothetical protein